MNGRAPAQRPVEILHSHPLVEEILDEHRDHAGGDEAGFMGYRGHVYRVLNLARALVPGEVADRDDKLAVAAAFHDLAAFSSLDYLAPSIEAQDSWLARTGRSDWSRELALVVAEHHRPTRYRGPHALLVESFRRADLIDVSQGLIRFGLARGYVTEVRRSFAVGPFFTRLVPLAIVRHVIRHPLDPVPLMRADRALKRAGHLSRSFDAHRPSDEK